MTIIGAKRTSRCSIPHGHNRILAPRDNRPSIWRPIYSVDRASLSITNQGIVPAAGLPDLYSAIKIASRDTRAIGRPAHREVSVLSVVNIYHLSCSDIPNLYATVTKISPGNNRVSIW